MNDPPDQRFICVLPHLLEEFLEIRVYHEPLMARTQHHVPFGEHGLNMTAPVFIISQREIAQEENFVVSLVVEVRRGELTPKKDASKLLFAMLDLISYMLE